MVLEDQFGFRVEEIKFPNYQTSFKLPHHGGTFVELHIFFEQKLREDTAKKSLLDGILKEFRRFNLPFTPQTINDVLEKSMKFLALNIFSVLNDEPAFSSQGRYMINVIINFSYVMGAKLWAPQEGFATISYKNPSALKAKGHSSSENIIYMNYNSLIMVEYYLSNNINECRRIIFHELTHKRDFINIRKNELNEGVEINPEERFVKGSQTNLGGSLIVVAKQNEKFDIDNARVEGIASFNEELSKQDPNSNIVFVTFTSPSGNYEGFLDKLSKIQKNQYKKGLEMFSVIFAYKLLQNPNISSQTKKQILRIARARGKVILQVPRQSYYNILEIFRRYDTDIFVKSYDDACRVLGIPRNRILIDYRTYLNIKNNQ